MSRRLSFPTKRFRTHLAAGITAIAGLAIGLGLASALAAVSEAILFRPLPVPNADRIVRVFSVSAQHPLGFVSYPDFEDYAKASSVSGIAAGCRVMLAIGRPGETPKVRLGVAVSRQYFEVLGVAAFRGRMFKPEDQGRPVIVLAHSFWRSHFGAKEDIVGKPVGVAARLFTVVGVTPPDAWLDPYFREDFYVPASAYEEGLLPGPSAPLADRSRRVFSLYARLAPTATVSQAQAELKIISQRLAAEYPATNRDVHAAVLTELKARKQANEPATALSETLLGGAVLLTLIACLNVSGVLLADAERRLGEFGLRSALGESLFRMIAGRIGQSLLFTAISLPVAFGCAAGLLRLVRSVATLPLDFNASLRPRLDERIVLALCVASAGVGLCCALVPALWLGLRRESALLTTQLLRTPTTGRFRALLLGLETAIATVLLCGAGMIVYQWLAQKSASPGYEPKGVLTIAFDPGQAGVDEAHSRRFYENAMAAARDVPAVSKVALAQFVPMGMMGAQSLVEIDGVDGPVSVWSNRVTPEYFEVIRLPVLRGRAFADGDGAGMPPVAIVNQTMAQYWPHGAAVGQRIRIGGRTIEIAGIVPRIDYFEPGESPKPFLYLPFAQNYVSRMVLHARANRDPEGLGKPLLDAIHRVDATEPVGDVRTIAAYLDQGGSLPARVGASLLPLTAAVAVTLILAGIGGRITRIIHERRRELGIRLAVGCPPRSFAWMLLTQTLTPVCAGAIFGALLAHAALGSALFSFATLHPASMGFVLTGAGVILFASLGACLGPVMRALRIFPAVTLREA